MERMGEVLQVGSTRPESVQDGAAAVRPDAAALTVRFDLRILRAVRRIIRSVDLYSKQLLATSQVTAPQLICLLAVVDFGPLTATSISREVSLSASTVVGILDRLEEKGWIVRTRTEDDRRMVLVRATPQGVALAKQAPSPLQQTLATRLAALPELEQATIALALERVVTLMDAQERGMPAAAETAAK